MFFEIKLDKILVFTIFSLLILIKPTLPVRFVRVCDTQGPTRTRQNRIKMQQNMDSIFIRKKYCKIVGCTYYNGTPENNKNVRMFKCVLKLCKTRKNLQTTTTNLNESQRAKRNKNTKKYLRIPQNHSKYVKIPIDTYDLFALVCVYFHRFPLISIYRNLS